MSITSAQLYHHYSCMQRLLTVVGAGGATVAAFTLTDFKFKICSAALPAVRFFDPETAHRLTIAIAKYGLLPSDLRKDDPRLRVRLWGRVFSNPLGIAAGFDKDAEVIEPVLNMGLGFMEVGVVPIHTSATVSQHAYHVPIRPCPRSSSPWIKPACAEFS